MSPRDISFYRNRIDSERSIAASEERPEVAKIHEQLANLYEKLLEIDLKDSVVRQSNESNSALV